MLAEVLMAKSCPTNYRAKNLIGHKFGDDCVVLAYHSLYKNQRLWVCWCKCGKEWITNTRNILNYTMSCKYCRNKKIARKNTKDHTGEIFGINCKVLEKLEESNKTYGLIMYKCECGICGDPFIIPSRRIFIQKACRKCSQRISRLRGKDHPSYNHSKTEEERKNVAKNRIICDEYRIFHQKVLKRDKYRCIICKNGKKRCVHHLDGFHWAKDKRMDIDNCVTLCKECHTQFHKWYGNYNNTKKQFDDFIFMKTFNFLEL